jgi:hypothetical protein
MKSIHAISTILAVWGIASSGVMASRPLCPARRGRLDGKNAEGVREIAGRARNTQSTLGMPGLLAAALLQGGSRTDHRHR